ncbi:up-regulator of cell proliferation-like [Lissotriton helveticus]
MASSSSGGSAKELTDFPPTYWCDQPGPLRDFTDCQPRILPVPQEVTCTLLEDESKALEKLLQRFKMEAYGTRKIPLSEVLDISSSSTDKLDLRSLEDVPWHFLRKLMSLNVTARLTRPQPGACNEIESGPKEGQNIDFDSLFDEDASGTSVNPLDVICLLFYLSDRFLQQEMMLKMSMCQFALPLLLPPCDGTKCTFMLWAMRDIVKQWRPHSLKDSKGFVQESLVLTPMPVISFVRLGSGSLSKSKILNEVLSPPQQRHDYFIHRDMECGNVPRVIASGLVEICCYFPGGRENSDIFVKPLAFANLRGDIELHRLQFDFLRNVSSAVFLFLNEIHEKEYTILSSIMESKTKTYFVINVQSSGKTKAFMKKLMQKLNLQQSQLLVKTQAMNDADFVRKCQSVLQTQEESNSVISLQAMADVARNLGVLVDEDDGECQKAKQCAEDITSEISDVVNYRETTMKLQGELWAGVTKVEKELCQMKNQGSTPTEDYISKLNQELTKLRKEQNDSEIPSGIMKFIKTLNQLSMVERCLFLKWMNVLLASISRQHLSNQEEMFRCMYAHCLGLGHFMREVGQFYEAECSMAKEHNMIAELRFTGLPKITAELLLEGFPLELIDGDVSNIPLQWVTAVLTELHQIIGASCRILVITVLGVQGTGKSTLLNSMFGLQFPVSSGRCTRGASMLLIKVKEDQRKELGFEFLLVIDTEGLKSPEHMTLGGTYEHDNELATLVVGLSDITIVNLAMENTTEMKDILEIVVHAFLRMEKLGKKPVCQFVHQNASDVAATGLNMVDRQYLFRQLNEMTKAAAKIEQHEKEITFADIMNYDPEKYNWYIPGLWHGSPPMASVSLGYSEWVHELKTSIFRLVRGDTGLCKPQRIPLFIEWMHTLLSAVKHEHFIFSFRNILVAEAYIQLTSKYSKWEWTFCKKMHEWTLEVETTIKNKSTEKLDDAFLNDLHDGALRLLDTGEEEILSSLGTYFDSAAENTIERYRQDFIQSAKIIRKTLEANTVQKYKEAVRMQKAKCQVQRLQSECLNSIEAEVLTCLKHCREKKSKLNDDELKKEFETMWENTVSSLMEKFHMPKFEVALRMSGVLKKELTQQGKLINKKMKEIADLEKCGLGSFTVKGDDTETSFYHRLKKGFKAEESFAESTIDLCNMYIEKTVKSKVNYDDQYCRELLHMIDGQLSQQDAAKLQTTPHFELNLKLHIFGRAARAFQAMHNDFVQQNDPFILLDSFKSQYFNTFRNVYLDKDACQEKAIEFCEKYLKPALTGYVNSKLGLEIVDDILSSGKSNEFSNRSFFQYSVLKGLLEENNFYSYLQYIQNYQNVIKRWILKYFKNKYRQNREFQTMEERLLSSITKIVRNTLVESRKNSNNSLSTFFEQFSEKLQKDLVLPQERLKVILFYSEADLDQFSKNVEEFLGELEKQILSEFEEIFLETKLGALPFNPQDALFKKLFGCGKTCPFCGVPCEAGNIKHEMHYASIHRPQGLNQYKDESSKILDHSICTSEVVSESRFRNSDTKGKFHPFKKYNKFYKDWSIQADVKLNTSDYWKFVFVQFNNDFAKEYKAKPAKLPPSWKKIKKEDALKSIEEVYRMK